MAIKRSEFVVDFTAFRKIDRRWSANLYWHVADRISFMPWPATGPKLRAALNIAPEGVRRFYLTGIIEGPISNGGLGQYFASRRPVWLHELAKQTICDFGSPAVVEIVNEAEGYLERNKDKLHKGMKWDDWVKVMGVVPMNKALNNIHRRYSKACQDLDDAKERYLRKHRDRFQ